MIFILYPAVLIRLIWTFLLFHLYNRLDYTVYLNTCSFLTVYIAHFIRLILHFFLFRPYSNLIYTVNLYTYSFSTVQQVELYGLFEHLLSFNRTAARFVRLICTLALFRPYSNPICTVTLLTCSFSTVQPDQITRQ